MPTYYPRAGPRELSLTPPEYSQHYNNGSCGVQYQPRTWADQSGVCASDHSYYGLRTSIAPSSTVMYQMPNYTLSNPTLGLPTRFYDPMRVSTLPPLQNAHDQSTMTAESGPQNHRQHYQSQPQTQPTAAAKEEKPVGGVSAKLDYELDVMTDFVIEMTQAIIFPSRNFQSPSEFRQWVHAMLSATRLPSSTIAMAMHYLRIRMNFLSRVGHPSVGRERMHTIITVALTLGSKFLDDNTFINRSWSDVSGIEVSKLNKEEIEWLTCMNWVMHRDPNEENGFSSWLRHWKEYESRAAVRAEQMSRNKLAPIDTSIRRQNSSHSIQSGFSASPPEVFSRAKPPQLQAQSHYTAPAWSYDHWQQRRPSLDNSPTSAPHTGPTTPEFYGGGHIWNQSEGYSRRTMFGLQPVTQVVAPPQQSFVPEQYPHYAAAWNGHGVGCVCLLCNHHQHLPSYAPSFTSQSVMA